MIRLLDTAGKHADLVAAALTRVLDQNATDAAGGLMSMAKRSLTSTTGVGAQKGFCSW